jgi:hypothetical protein
MEQLRSRPKKNEKSFKAHKTLFAGIPIQKTSRLDERTELDNFTHTLRKGFMYRWFALLNRLHPFLNVVCSYLIFQALVECVDE